MIITENKDYEQIYIRTGMRYKDCKEYISECHDKYRNGVW